MARSKQIANPAGLYGLTADTDTQVIIEAVVGTTAAINAGDAVAIDVTGCIIAYTSFASANTATDIIGVVGWQNDGAVGLDTTTTRPTFAVGSVVPVIVRGVARVAISTVAAIAKGDILANSTVAGKLATSTTSQLGTVVAIALESSTAAGSSLVSIRAIVGKM